jgi:prepilin peptidase CpaA
MVSDFRSLVIPNWLVVALVAAFAVFAAARLELGSIVVHVAIAAVVLLFFSAFFVAGWIAGGDVKFIAAIALWMGPENTSLFVLLTALLGALLALALLQVKRYGDRLAGGILGSNWAFRRARALAEQGQCPYGVAIGAAALLSGAGIFR